MSSGIAPVSSALNDDKRTAANPTICGGATYRAPWPIRTAATDALYLCACDLAARLVFEPALLSHADIADLEEIRRELERRGVGCP